MRTKSYIPTVFGHYNEAPDSVPQPGGGDVLVETAGYIPKAVQLQMLLDSGKALDDYHKALFPDLVPEQDLDDYDVDPTLSKGYDYFDYRSDVVRVRSNLRRKVVENEARRAEGEATSPEAAPAAASPASQPAATPQA